jgi:hypothetical protein
MSEASVFSASGLPARERVTEWVNIKKNVGDKVYGIFLGWWINKSRQEGFKDQISMALEQAEGKIIGVSVADTIYMRSRIEGTEVGDEVGLKYEGDKDTGKPQKAKIVKFYNPALEERKKKGEVKVTEPESIQEAGAATGPETDDEDPGF